MLDSSVPVKVCICPGIMARLNHASFSPSISQIKINLHLCNLFWHCFFIQKGKENMYHLLSLSAHARSLREGWTFLSVLLRDVGLASARLEAWGLVVTGFLAVSELPLPPTILSFRLIQARRAASLSKSYIACICSVVMR